jgi:hypothetical protein
VRGQYTHRGKGELGQAGSRTFDGNGLVDNGYGVARYRDVITPDGRETESSNGDTANGTGHAVIHSAFGGAPATWASRAPVSPVVGPRLTGS